MPINIIKHTTQNINMSMKALVIKEGKKVGVEEREIIPLEKLQKDEVRVKVVAVAVNPTDWKHVSVYGAPAGVIVGCDYSGVVELVGESVSHIKIGDRIGGFVHGAYYTHTGSFAEHVVALGDLAFHKPDHFSHEDNATLGVGALTAAACLYQKLNLPKPSAPLSPSNSPSYVLVWSGATSVGQYAVQLAALSGFTVITTCSPRNFQLLSSLGASHCFDYRDPDVVKKIREVTNNKLEYVVDCISEEESLTKSTESMGENGGKIAAILFTEIPNKRKDVEIIRTLLYTATGKEFQMGSFHFAPIPEDREFMAKFIKEELEPLLIEKKLKANVTRLCQGGLDSIHEGMDYVQAGKVSGEKLVYHLQDE